MINKPLYASRTSSSENAFIIKKLDQEYKNDILKVRSCLPYLKSLAVGLRRGDRDCLNSTTFLRMEKIMSELCYFIFDIDKPNIEGKLQYLRGEPHPGRQQILREMKVIDIFVDLLYCPFSSGMFNLSTLTAGNPVTGLLSDVYSTMRFAIQEYRPNELYASQWLGLFMYQSIKTNGANDIQAGRTLTELIDNNKKILESRIESGIISDFIYNLATQEKDTKTVDILRAICICDGKPMIKNQKELSLQIFNNAKLVETLIYPIRRVGNEVEVQAIDLLSCWYLLSQYEPKYNELKEADSEKRLKSYEYFVASVNLCADLCMERNYLAIEALQKLYPLDCCIQILKNEDYPINLRCAFCRLVDHLWVQIYPYEVVKMPEFTKTLIDHSETTEPSIACTSQDIDRFEVVKNFCQHYLSSVFPDRNTASKVTQMSREDHKLLLVLSKPVLDLSK